MHNGFLNIDNQKMSKSLGNFFTVRDIREKYDLEAVRMFLLSAQYRSPLNFSQEQIAQAKAALDRMYTARDNFDFLEEGAQERALNAEETQLVADAKACVEKFDAAMDDDLNTADAIGAIFELIKHANVALKPGCAKDAVDAVIAAFKEMTGVLGLVKPKEEEKNTEVDALVEARAQARKEKNWKESDRIRDQLKEMGYIVEDTAQGQKVRKA